MFTVDNTVLMLIDIQGTLATLMHERERLYSSLQLIIKSMKILKVPMIWLEQTPEKLGPTIQEVSRHLEDTEPISKDTFSCCDSHKFMDALRETNRNQLLLTGIETHICIFQTFFDLISEGYDVQVIADCVSSRTLANKKIALERMRQSGGVVTSIEMILFELMRSTKAEGFRDIVRLIK